MSETDCYNYAMDKKILSVLGAVINPLLLIVPWFLCGKDEINVSGLFYLEKTTVYMHILYFYFLGYLLFCLYRHVPVYKWVLFGITSLTAVWIPYIEGTVSAGLHLLFSYSSFLLFGWIIVPLLIHNQKEQQLFTAVLFTCVLLCVTAGKITGSSEILFAWYVSAWCAHYRNIIG